MSRPRFRKKNFRSIMTSPIMLVVLLVLFVFIARATFSINGKRLETEKNLAQVKEEYGELEDRLGKLENDLMYIKSEKGVEAELRTRYGVAKPGERVVVILEDKNTEVPQEQTEQRSVFQKVIDFLNPFN